MVCGTAGEPSLFCLAKVGDAKPPTAAFVTQVLFLEGCFRHR
jgi:hypothetical protein